MKITKLGNDFVNIWFMFPRTMKSFPDLMSVVMNWRNIENVGFVTMMSDAESNCLNMPDVLKSPSSSISGTLVTLS